MAAAFQTTDVYRVPPEDTPPTQHSGCTEAMKGFPGGGMTLVAPQAMEQISFSIPLSRSHLTLHSEVSAPLPALGPNSRGLS